MKPDKDCHYCTNAEYRTKDYRYNFHVPGGFFGCSLKQTALMNVKPCDNYIKKGV